MLIRAGKNAGYATACLSSGAELFGDSGKSSEAHSSLGGFPCEDYQSQCLEDGGEPRNNGLEPIGDVVGLYFQAVEFWISVSIYRMDGGMGNRLASVAAE